MTDLQCAYKGCPHPIEAEGRCIFHLLKRTTAEKEAMTANDRAAVDAIEATFHQRFNELMERDEFAFRGFEFPSLQIFSQTFRSSLDFTNATFRQPVLFHGVTFETTPVFDRAAFAGPVEFYETNFEAGGSFRLTDFLAGAKFINTRLKGFEMTFNGSRFSGYSTFGWFQQGDVIDPYTFWTAHFMRFTALRMDSGAEVVFEKQNMVRASFLDTNLARLTFRDARWFRHGRRQALSDEFDKGIFLRGELEKVAANYRDLVLNYEARRDFETAEDFHIGEMEVRRKKLGAKTRLRLAARLGRWINWYNSYWTSAHQAKADNRAIPLFTRLMIRQSRRFDTITRLLAAACQAVVKIRSWLNVYSLYWLSSRYGTSYIHAFGVLGLLILMFSAIFLYTGLLVKTGNTVQSVTDYGNALLYTISILAFDRQRSYEPIGPWSQFWTYVATVLFPAQGALILFAIRRRFRR